jgi:type II secretory pathway component PulM
MSPLVSLTLLGFGALLVLALLLWVLLSPPRSRRGREASSPPAVPRSPTVTNDAVRGARVRPSDRATNGDPFDSFLRADPDDR